MIKVSKITRGVGGVSVEPMLFLTLEEARREARATNPNMCHHRTGREKPRSPWGNPSGYVYFVLCKATKSLKIGFTANTPAQRLRELQGANPTKLRLLGYFRGTQDQERALHKELQDHRIHREWFYYDCEVKQFVAALLASHEDVAA